MSIIDRPKAVLANKQLKETPAEQLEESEMTLS